MLGIRHEIQVINNPTIRQAHWQLDWSLIRCLVYLHLSHKKDICWRQTWKMIRKQVVLFPRYIWPRLPLKPQRKSRGNLISTGYVPIDRWSIDRSIQSITNTCNTSSLSCDVIACYLCTSIAFSRDLDETIIIGWLEGQSICCRKNMLSHALSCHDWIWTTQSDLEPRMEFRHTSQTCSQWKGNKTIVASGWSKQ